MDRFTRGFDGDPVGRANFKPVDPPYNAEYAARFAAVTASHARGEPINDPTATCLWPGFPRILLAPYPTEIVYADGGKLVIMIHEYMSQVRHIHADGRKHPDDLEPSYNGHTIGHWEGQTLVTDTVGLRADTMLQNTGMMHSDAMTVQERLWLAGPDTLKDEITVLDPKAFTKPYVVTKTYQRQPDWEIQEYVCADNNRNPVNDGVTGAELIPKR